MKKKVVHQKDLERLTCKACGAPLNKDLKCEYCGTQWYDGKNEIYTVDKDADKEIMIEYEWVDVHRGKDNHIVARYEMTPKYTTYGMSIEEAAEAFTKLSKGVGINGKD